MLVDERGLSDDALVKLIIIIFITGWASHFMGTIGFFVCCLLLGVLLAPQLNAMGKHIGTAFRNRHVSKNPDNKV